MTLWRRTIADPQMSQLMSCAGPRDIERLCQLLDDALARSSFFYQQRILRHLHGSIDCPTYWGRGDQRATG